MTTIGLAQSDAEIGRCNSVVAEPRGLLGGEAGFLGRVRRQLREGGYRLFSVHDRGAGVAVAGFGVSEWLARGKAMPVDDQVSAGAARSQGHGGALLDSGLQRGAAHRFDRTKGMEIGALHLRLPLQGPGDGQGE